MPYRLVTFDGGRRRIYDFEPMGEQGRQGWVYMWLMRIEDDQPLPGVPAIQTYDPAVHDGGSHYMSHPWRARSKRVRGGGREYSLTGAFGNPGCLLQRVI